MIFLLDQRSIFCHIVWSLIRLSNTNDFNVKTQWLLYQNMVVYLWFVDYFMVGEGVRFLYTNCNELLCMQRHPDGYQVLRTTSARGVTKSTFILGEMNWSVLGVIKRHKYQAQWSTNCGFFKCRNLKGRRRSGWRLIGGIYWTEWITVKPVLSGHPRGTG